ncbi:MAG: hypothetical protein HQL61_09255 [Magnetococcales bacterium]|uniref:Uncharacterized protein n=1 Tax=Candidatus Magnetobacterium casense TaxID=1455061 RepID=A0ABS6RWQ0_9BACT|nr:hypothetical protein [Candidatus Magnetobacterium casensis]MBF0607718.1 hypothetical protein [Nitrospirota bacterium]MBV6340688.1 hypothetical protein [Candidatus Magnetobacterium casensis]
MNNVKYTEEDRYNAEAFTKKWLHNVRHQSNDATREKDLLLPKDQKKPDIAKFSKELLQPLEPATRPESEPKADDTSVELLPLVEECINILDRAIDSLENEDDEIDSEIQMSILLATAYKFYEIEIGNRNLFTLIAMLRLGLFVHRKTPYSLEEIKTIHSVFNIIKDNISMNSDIYKKCKDLLCKINITPAIIFSYPDDQYTGKDEQ